MAVSRISGSALALLRALVILAGLLFAVLQFSLIWIFGGGRVPRPQRTRWLSSWCRFTLRILGIRVEQTERFPASGLVVSNHLSYLDILVFSSLAPAVFVAKIEVKSWPLFGLFTRLGGSFFIDRWKLKKLPAAVAQAEAVLRAGGLLLVFPEATTTDGGALLPFRPALFEAAVRSGTPLTASHVWYTDAEGSFQRELCWFGDVQLAPHVANAFSKTGICAHVTVSRQSRCFASRKIAAAATQEEVQHMNDLHHGSAEPALAVSATS